MRHHFTNSCCCYYLHGSVSMDKFPLGKWKKLKIIEYNIQYFKKTQDMNVCKDKTYSRLLDNDTKNKIINRTLQKKDYNKEKVYKFLALLK